MTSVTDKPPQVEGWRPTNLEEVKALRQQRHELWLDKWTRAIWPLLKFWTALLAAFVAGPTAFLSILSKLLLIGA